MQVRATAPGRGKSLVVDGVGRLVCTANIGYEAKQLQVLLNELRGSIDFWTPIMWAAQQKRLTKTEEQSLKRIIIKIAPDFKLFCEGDE